MCSGLKLKLREDTSKSHWRTGDVKPCVFSTRHSVTCALRCLLRHGSSSSVAICQLCSLIPRIPVLLIDPPPQALTEPCGGGRRDETQSLVLSWRQRLEHARWQALSWKPHFRTCRAALPPMASLNAPIGAQHLTSNLSRPVVPRKLSCHTVFGCFFYHSVATNGQYMSHTTLVLIISCACTLMFHCIAPKHG